MVLAVVDVLAAAADAMEAVRGAGARAGGHCIDPQVKRPMHKHHEPGFRWRGAEIARIEGLSDAVFAFAVTLLVVSLEVPKTFNELAALMRGCRSRLHTSDAGVARAEPLLPP